MTQSHDQIAAFADYLNANPEDGKALDTQLEQGGALARIKAFAEERGFVFTVSELADVLRQSAESSGELSDEQLAAVSGGTGGGDDDDGDEVIFSIIYRAAGRHVGTTLLGAQRPRF